MVSNLHKNELHFEVNGYKLVASNPYSEKEREKEQDDNNDKDIGEQTESENEQTQKKNMLSSLISSISTSITSFLEKGDFKALEKIFDELSIQQEQTEFYQYLTGRIQFKIEWITVVMQFSNTDAADTFEKLKFSLFRNGVLVPIDKDSYESIVQYIPEGHRKRFRDSSWKQNGKGLYVMTTGESRNQCLNIKEGIVYGDGKSDPKQNCTHIYILDEHVELVNKGFDLKKDVANRYIVKQNSFYNKNNESSSRNPEFIRKLKDIILKAQNSDIKQVRPYAKTLTLFYVARFSGENLNNAETFEKHFGINQNQMDELQNNFDRKVLEKNIGITNFDSYPALNSNITIPTFDSLLNRIIPRWSNRVHPESPNPTDPNVRNRNVSETVWNAYKKGASTGRAAAALTGVAGGGLSGLTSGFLKGLFNTSPDAFKYGLKIGLEGGEVVAGATGTVVAGASGEAVGAVWRGGIQQLPEVLNKKKEISVKLNEIKKEFGPFYAKHLEDIFKDYVIPFALSSLNKLLDLLDSLRFELRFRRSTTSTTPSSDSSETAEDDHSEDHSEEVNEEERNGNGIEEKIKNILKTLKYLKNQSKILFTQSRGQAASTETADPPGTAAPTDPAASPVPAASLDPAASPDPAATPAPAVSSGPAASTVPDASPSGPAASPVPAPPPVPAASSSSPLSLTSRFGFGRRTAEVSASTVPSDPPVQADSQGMDNQPIRRNHSEQPAERPTNNFIQYQRSKSMQPLEQQLRRHLTKLGIGEKYENQVFSANIMNKVILLNDKHQIENILDEIVQETIQRLREYEEDNEREEQKKKDEQQKRDIAAEIITIRQTLNPTYLKNENPRITKIAQNNEMNNLIDKNELYELKTILSEEHEKLTTKSKADKKRQEIAAEESKRLQSLHVTQNDSLDSSTQINSSSSTQQQGSPPKNRKNLITRVLGKASSVAAATASNTGAVVAPSNNLKTHLT